MARDHYGASPARRLSRRAGFWLLATSLLALMAAAGAPSPLYRVYQQQWGFSTGVLTLVFAVYALALLATLLTVGGLSDHVGRRPVLVAALVVEAVSMGTFLSAPTGQHRSSSRAPSKVWRRGRQRAQSRPG
jgi:MFS family permease